MGRQRLEAFARAHVPNTHTLVERSGHDQIALGIEVAAEHVIAVSLERLQAFARAQLPDLERLVVGGADHETRIARPSYV